MTGYVVKLSVQLSLCLCEATVTIPVTLFPLTMVLFKYNYSPSSYFQIFKFPIIIFIKMPKCLALKSSAQQCSDKLRDLTQAQQDSTSPWTSVQDSL